MPLDSGMWQSCVVYIFQAFTLCTMEFHWDRRKSHHYYWPETPSFLICFGVSCIKFYFILKKNNYYLKTFYQLHYYFFFFRGIGGWKGREKGWRPNSNVAKSVAGEQNEISGIGLIKGDKVWSLLQGSPSEAWWFKAADCQFGPHPCATEDLPLFLGFIFGNILKHNVFSPYSIATLLHTR